MMIGLLGDRCHLLRTHLECFLDVISDDFLATTDENSWPQKL